MSLLKDENLIITNFIQINNFNNKASSKKKKNNNEGLKTDTKSSFSILRKIDKNDKEKNQHQDNYKSEYYENQIKRKSHFDIFRNNIESINVKTNTSDFDVIQYIKKSLIGKKSNEIILNRKRSKKLNFTNCIENINKNNSFYFKSKFNEFQARKSQIGSYKNRPNDERRLFLVKSFFIYFCDIVSILN
jgi:hypothetical protein